MNFKDILDKLGHLSEATEKTKTGVKHTAEPGGYGRKFDTDDEGDEKKEKKPEVKRGRGRPKKGADSETGQVAKYDNAKSLQSFMIGNVPKKSKELEKLPKKKHTLKDWFEQLDKEVVSEETPIPVVGKQGDTQSTGAGFLHITDTSPAGQAMKKALGDLATQKKAQIVMPTAQQTTKPAAPGATGQAPAGTQPVSEKWGTETKVSPEEKGKYAGKSKAELLKSYNALKKSGPHKKGSPEFGRMRELAFAIRAKGDWGKVKEADQPPNDALASPLTMEGKESKPDFLDIDKDGNKKEPMKKAAQDKKKVKEGMEHRLKAARHAGKAHALAKEGYNCRYDDMEEAKCYHEGYKEGLDECYGQGMQVIETPAATVPGMAQQAEPAMEDDMYEMDKTEYMKHKAKATPGDTFKAFGQTMHDKDVLEADGVFESWDKELNALLTENTQVDEGMSVSISKGQQGMPDSVSVTAQDAEAEQLLSMIKQAGLGLFGGEDKPELGLTPAHAGEEPAEVGTGGEDINVVGDHDGMMALIKKVTGAGSDHDYADEEGDHGHAHGDECETCGKSPCGCDDEEMVEDETLDQREEEVAEDLTTDAQADEEAEAQEDEALAKFDAGQENEQKEEQVNEWANQVGAGPGKGTDASFEQDIEFMTKVISGGLNKPKSTGQTTIPVIAGQDTRMEDPTAWARLAGIKK